MRRALLLVGALLGVLVLAAVAWSRGEGPGAPAGSRTFDRPDFSFTFQYPSNLEGDERPRREQFGLRRPLPSRIEPPGEHGGRIMVSQLADAERSPAQLVAGDRRGHERLSRMARRNAAPEPGAFEPPHVERHSGIEMVVEETGYLEGDRDLKPDEGRRFRFALAGATWAIECGGLGRRRRLMREACERVVGSIRMRSR